MATSERLPPLSDEHLRQIGRVTVAWNKLEATVRLLALNLSQLDDDAARVLLVGESFSVLLSKVKSLVEIRVTDKQLRSKAEEWLGEARYGNHLRIDVVHSSWIPGAGEEAIVLRLTKSKTLGALLTADQVAQRADVIEQIAAAGLLLFQRLQLESQAG